jgi:N-acetylneuraminic acid mutarotase
MAFDRRHLAISGGVWPEFLTDLPHDGPHPGFSTESLIYNSTNNSWETVASLGFGPAAPQRVTAPVVAWKNRTVVPGGEIAPGIRTPTVLSFQAIP